MIGSIWATVSPNGSGNWPVIPRYVYLPLSIHRWVLFVWFGGRTNCVRNGVVNEWKTAALGQWMNGQWSMWQRCRPSINCRLHTLEQNRNLRWEHWPFWLVFIAHINNDNGTTGCRLVRQRKRQFNLIEFVIKWWETSTTLLAKSRPVDSASEWRDQSTTRFRTCFIRFNVDFHLLWLISRPTRWLECDDRNKLESMKNCRREIYTGSFKFSLIDQHLTIEMLVINKVHFLGFWADWKFWNKTRKRRQNVPDQITVIRLKLSPDLLNQIIVLKLNFNQ